MNDNPLIILFSSRLEAALVASPWTNIIVEQKPQQTQQGLPTSPTVFFQKLFDTNYGFQSVKEAYNATDDDFDHTETQLLETTFQVSAFVPQNPADLSIPTAADVVNFLKMFLQSRPTISLWRQQSVSLLRITDIRNPSFEDEKDRFEFDPNFDVIITHNQQINFKTPRVNAIDGESIPV